MLTSIFSNSLLNCNFKIGVQNVLLNQALARPNSFEREIRNTGSTVTEHLREDENDVANFLNEMSIRDRLIMTTNREINTDQNIEANIPIVSLHSADELASTSFKCTMKIIMMT